MSLMLKHSVYTTPNLESACKLRNKALAETAKFQTDLSLPGKKFFGVDVSKCHSLVQCV